MMVNDNQHLQAAGGHGGIQREHFSGQFIEFLLDELETAFSRYRARSLYDS